MGDTKALVEQLITPSVAVPIRYATVISVNAAAGTCAVRPSNATAADGTQDVTAHYLTPTTPGVGAVVRIEAYKGDVLIVGAPAVDAFPGIPFAMAAGTGTWTVTSLAATAGAAAATITFPAGRFTQTPRVSVAQTSLPGSTGDVWLKPNSVTSSGFTLYVYNGYSVSITAGANFDWIAVQMTSTSGSG
jgi:hypothetical protein